MTNEQFLKKLEQDYSKFGLMKSLYLNINDVFDLINSHQNPAGIIKQKDVAEMLGVDKNQFRVALSKVRNNTKKIENEKVSKLIEDSIIIELKHTINTFDKKLNKQQKQIDLLLEQSRELNLKINKQFEATTSLNDELDTMTSKTNKDNETIGKLVKANNNMAQASKKRVNEIERLNNEIIKLKNYVDNNFKEKGSFF